MMNAEPRVQLESRKEAKELNGNARKHKCKLLLLLPLADLALVGGFQQTKDKLEELMATPLTEKQTRLLGEVVSAIVQDAQERQPGLDNVISDQVDIEAWLNSL
jgi:hypothetical protein